MNSTLALILLLSTGAGADREEFSHLPFYLPENVRYTIVDSAMDSIRFTLGRTLVEDSKGHLVSKSSFVGPDGEIMGWHDFGNLEGPGWAANAVGGAYEIHLFGDFIGNSEMTGRSIKILDHVLEGGFIDESGLIRGYRDTVKNEIVLNYKHNSEWFCPGSMAKIGYQLLIFSDRLGDDPRSEVMKKAAIRCAAWIDRHLKPVPNGWFPRRCTATGEVYRKTPEGGNDSFWQSSADGLFILQLQAELTRRGMADYRRVLREKIANFRKLGGIFGSINHDTYDPNENVAYSVAFRTFLLASRVLKDADLREYAYRRCLDGLERFKMHEDRNGVATKGLLYMERTWNTAYMWENAEASLAYFEASRDTQARDSRLARAYQLDGLTILRAAAKHHYGPHGFLSEGIDWDNIVSEKHHIDGKFYGAIRYTEPFLNNQHICEPTLYYLRDFAARSKTVSATEWRDIEGNVIYASAHEKIEDRKEGGEKQE